jgi:RNA-directed DNA polymerase
VQVRTGVHPDKTRLIHFGRYAAKQREKLGEGKPETFDFLRFTHFCTRSRKWGSFVIGRKTIKKRMGARLLAIKIELRRTMHDPIAKTGAWMKRILQGHLNYVAVSGNHPSPGWFFNKVRRLWLMPSVGSENVCYRELITWLRTVRRMP